MSEAPAVGASSGRGRTNQTTRFPVLSRSCPPACGVNLVKRLTQIVDQVLEIFNAYRVSDEGFGDAAGGALLPGRLDVTCGGWRTRDRLDRTQVRGQMCVSQARQEGFHR